MAGKEGRGGGGVGATWGWLFPGTKGLDAPITDGLALAASRSSLASTSLLLPGLKTFSCFSLRLQSANK